MKDSKYAFWIEPKGSGFFVGPSFGADFQLPKTYREDPALLCAYALDRAKKGDFSLIPGLLDLYGKSGLPIVDAMVLGSIAFAGPGSCFPRLVDFVKREPDLNKVLDYCGVMALRRELSYLPIFLDKYLSNRHERNAEYLLDYIGDLIGDAESALDPDDCEAQVLDCYRQLLDRFGTERALVFRGESYNVSRLARYILDAVKKPYFLSNLRRCFEAATGIDCSSWYQDGNLRPLAATAILEEFLDSPESAKFEDGVRYFFGHRIPD